MPYPLEIVKKSRELLAERREKATSEAIERRMAVAKRAPRALEIEREISTTSARLASAVLSGEDVAAQVPIGFSFFIKFCQILLFKFYIHITTLR